MKQLALILLCASLVGCERSVNVPYTQYDYIGDGVHIVKIGECEYVQSYMYAKGYVYTHCGDCHNPIHLTTKQ